MGTYRLLARLTVEALKHHRTDGADTLAHQGALVGEELGHAFPFHLGAARPQLFLQQSRWFNEVRDADVLACRACQLQHEGLPSRLDLPLPRERS